MQTFLNLVEQQSASITAQIEENTQIIAATAFKRKPVSEIPAFIDDLPDLFSKAGVTVLKLGYQAREKVEEFEDLAFEAHIRCNYYSLRQMLHRMETHATGIRIDQLEFVSLDDEQHQTQVKLVCKVRFNGGSS
jgi:hypothetical protein